MKTTLKEQARQIALKDIQKYEGDILRTQRFIGKSGYKWEGYSPIKKELNQETGKIENYYDPYDAPQEYNFLVGMQIRESVAVSKN